MPRIYTSRFPDDLVGLVFGERTILAEVERRHSGRRVRWKCSCGATGEGALCSVAKSKACYACSMANRAPRPVAEPSELTTMLREARLRCPEVWLGDTPESVEAVAELAALTGPMSLREVGALLELSYERVRQIERIALRAYESRAHLAGLSLPVERGASTQELLELAGWEDVA